MNRFCEAWNLENRIFLLFIWMNYNFWLCWSWVENLIEDVLLHLMVHTLHQAILCPVIVHHDMGFIKLCMKG